MYGLHGESYKLDKGQITLLTQFDSEHRYHKPDNDVPCDNLSKVSRIYQFRIEYCTQNDLRRHSYQ